MLREFQGDVSFKLARTFNAPAICAGDPPSAKPKRHEHSVECVSSSHVDPPAAKFK